MNTLKTNFVQDVGALGALPFFLLIISFLYILNQNIFALQLLLAIVLCHLLTYLIRWIYHKDRPAPQKYHSLVEKIDASSFPSLHAMRAMTFFVFGIVHVPSLIAYSLFGTYLFCISFSRHYLHKHDAIDILGGIFIGGIISFLIISLHL